MFLREQELASSPTSLSTSSFPKFHQANQVLRGYTARNKAFFFTLLSFSCASLVRPSSERRRRGGCVLSAEERGRRGRGRGGALAEGQPRGRNLSFLFLTPLANLALSTISYFCRVSWWKNTPKTSQIPLSRKVGAVLVGAIANSHSRAMTAAVGTGGTF